LHEVMLEFSLTALFVTITAHRTVDIHSEMFSESNITQNGHSFLENCVVLSDGFIICNLWNLCLLQYLFRFSSESLIHHSPTCDKN